MQRLLKRLGRFKYSIHNIIAHPMSEILFQTGFEDAGNWVHDVTLPDDPPGQGRG